MTTLASQAAPIAAETIHVPGILWYTRCPVPTPLGIAVQQGHVAREFLPDGLTVKSLRDDESKAVRESHYDHKLLNSFRQGGSIPAIWARSAGRDTRVIGLTWTDEYQVVVTRPASGIRTPKDLAGRRVGLPRRDGDVVDFPRAMALRGIDNALRLGGLSLAQVEVVDFQRREGFADSIRSQPNGAGDQGWNPSERQREQPELEALLAGSVDAIYLKGARALGTVEEHGLSVVLDIGNHPDPLIRANNGTPRPLTVDAHLARTRPDVVRRILARVIDAGAWASAHPDETADYIAREVGATADLVRRAYGPDLHRHLGTGLDPAHVAGFRDFIGWLHRQGFIPNAIDVDAWIDAEPLSALGGLAQVGKAG